MEILLVELCKIGNLELIKELFRNYPDTNVHCGNECASRWACKNSHVEVAQWLKQEFPDINHHAQANWVYKNTTNPEILKWLESECYTPHHHIKASVE